MFNEFLGLCPIGGEVAFNNELKLNGFALTKKFPGRLFFKSTKDQEFTSEALPQNHNTLKTATKAKKLIGIKGNFSKSMNSAPDTPPQSPVKHTHTHHSDESLFLQCLKANMQLRLTDRIGLVVASFACKNFDDLFSKINEVAWENFFFKDSKILIEKVACSNSKIDSERAVQSIASKAIYSRLCSLWNLHTLPETGKTFNLRIYIDEDWARVVLDLSGEPLYHRGYRLSGGIAPLRETMASLLLQLMQWKRKKPLHDPFCGSGTIPIEALLYGLNVPPGFLRKFSFQGFKLFSDNRFEAIFSTYKAKAALNIQTEHLIRISGSDIAKEAVSLSSANANNACVLIEGELQRYGISKKLNRPKFTLSDVETLKPEYDEGLLLGNPPYGERLGDETEALEVYKKIAKTIKGFKNWEKAFITNKNEFCEVLEKSNPNLQIKKRLVKLGKLDTMLFSF